MSETIGFKTDVKKVMDIIIRSLYQHEEVFLRELISNASDALNKVRIKSLTNEEVYQKDAELKITISANRDEKTLTITDTGSGMTHKELVNNLGTIARSGTMEFLEHLKDDSDVDELIGQFGVGFYSAFLVANEVAVRTRSADPTSTAYEWRSKGEDNFTITEIEKKDRGTEIILYLKEDAEKYLNEWEVRNIVKKYSDFVNFPIFWEQVEDLDEEEESADEDSEEEGEEEEESKEPEPLNSMKAIWRASPSEVTDEEYTEFYRHVSSKWDEPFLKIHIRREMPFEFYALLYVPKTKPVMFAVDSDWGLKLYSKKVLIQEDNKDLIPSYFRFMVGVVDSEDLPLNVSREVVQSGAMIRKISKVITKQIIKELKSMAEKDKEKYLEFFREFGNYLKEGIAAEDEYKKDLIELLRFHSTRDDVDGRTGGVSLDDYLVSMKPGQEEIYYLTGHNLDHVKTSPHLEYYKKEGLEVLLMGDPIDNFLMMHLREYNEKKFKVIDEDESDSSSDDKSGDEETDEKEAEPVIAKFKEVLGDKVKDVKFSERLVDSPARLVTPKGGLNSDMLRAMKYMQDNPLSSLGGGMSSKVLQLNPNHEIIKGIEKHVENEELVKPIVLQLYANAMLKDGEQPDVEEMVTSVQAIMESALLK